MQPPVWIFKSGFTPYTASNHVQNWLWLSDSVILYHILYGLGISILASIFPCPTWCSWSLWCTGMIHRDQYLSFPFFQIKVSLQIYSIGFPHISFLLLLNSHLCYVDPSSPVMKSSYLAPI